MSTTVQRWVRRFEQGGLEALREGERSGRPSALDAAQWRKLQVICVRPRAISAYRSRCAIAGCCPSRESSLQLRVVEIWELQVGNTRHTAAKAGTKDCAQAFRRAVDSPQRCRLR